MGSSWLSSSPSSSSLSPLSPHLDVSGCPGNQGLRVDGEYQRVGRPLQWGHHDHHRRRHHHHHHHHHYHHYHLTFMLVGVKDLRVCVSMANTREMAAPCSEAVIACIRTKPNTWSSDTAFWILPQGGDTSHGPSSCVLNNYAIHSQHLNSRQLTQYGRRNGSNRWMKCNHWFRTPWQLA